MKSSIYFTDRAEVAVGPFAKAQLLIGDHPRMDPLRTLDMSSKALFTACLPHSNGVLDDHFESWFITSPTRLTRVNGGVATTWIPCSASRTARSGSTRPRPPGGSPLEVVPPEALPSRADGAER